jgi:hypothetical protein
MSTIIITVLILHTQIYNQKKKRTYIHAGVLKSAPQENFQKLVNKNAKKVKHRTDTTTHFPLEIFSKTRAPYQETGNLSPY